MREIPEDRQIYISGRIAPELLNKVRIAPFLFALHENIDLIKYGTGIKRFYFTFLLLGPQNTLFFPGIHYDKDKKEVEVAVEVDYDTAKKASKEEVIKSMETVYLEGIDQIKTLSLENFDVEAFKQDVQAVFTKEGWYESFA